MAKSSRRHTWILIVLLLVFGAVFVMRGPVRALAKSSDLAHLYSAGVLWVEGGSPYDGKQCAEVMRRAGYAEPEAVDFGSFYPPSTIALLSPLGLLSWATAKLVWMLLNLVAGAAVVWALVNWMRFGLIQTRWLVALLLVVGFGATGTTFSLGQLSLVCAGCAFAGLALLDRGKPLLAGVLIGLACLVKPQLGLGFLLLAGLRREWLVVAIGVGVIAVVSGIGIGRLMHTVPDWASQLSGNIAFEQEHGIMLDSSPDGELRYQMIDLRPLVHLVLPTPMVNLGALLLVTLFAGIALIKLVRLGLDRHTLLSVSGVGLLLLMPIYHRYYDAMFLLPLFVLLMNQWLRSRTDPWLLTTGVAMLPLTIPLQSVIYLLHLRGVVPDALHFSWFWQNLVLQVQSWCLLIAAVALIIWTWKLPINDENRAVSHSMTIPNNQP
ncbi:MAG: glycosyltransferase family 87 protein [Planctomycetota bacterium]